MQRQQEPGLQNLVAIVSQVGWGPMPAQQKKKLLKFLTTPT
jgi:hypothetical protein